jgi:threonine/homoserine/homoserine lactone efflux protein
MPSISTLIAFVGAAMLLVTIPGPNHFYIVGMRLSAGRRTAVASALGVETGTLIHAAAAVVGVSAILRSSALAFETVRHLGVAYLIYLAVMAFRSSHEAGTLKRGKSISFRVAYLRGVVVNMLNPRVSLFFWRFSLSSSIRTPAPLRCRS